MVKQLVRTKSRRMCTHPPGSAPGDYLEGAGSRNRDLLRMPPNRSCYCPNLLTYLKSRVSLCDEIGNRIPREQVTRKLASELIEQTRSAVVLVEGHVVDLAHIGIPARYLVRDAIVFDRDRFPGNLSELGSNRHLRRGSLYF
jgi:hypothetical protein